MVWLSKCCRAKIQHTTKHLSVIRGVKEISAFTTLCLQIRNSNFYADAHDLAGDELYNNILQLQLSLFLLGDNRVLDSEVFENQDIEDEMTAVN